MFNIWLPEPINIDDSWRGEGEDTINWLSRSTLPKAKEMRAFLNYNLSKLPYELAFTIFSNLKHRFHPAFFELIVGRLIQEIGYKFKYEHQFESGKRPDYFIDTPIGKVIIEATSPIFNAKVGNFYKRNNPLIGLIKELAPKDWIVNIHHLPELGFNDSKKYFKKVIKEEFLKIDENNELEPNKILIQHRFPKGKLELSLKYKKGSRSAIRVYPGIGYVDNSIYKIEKILDKKRRQVRNVNCPVILAIQGSFTGTDLEDFDNVLYGHTFEKIGRDGRIIEKGFRADGKFVTKNKNPTYQGVLAFDEVGFTQLSIPTLYLHKNADMSLIDTFNSFHIRLFDENVKKIVNIPAKREDYLNNFKFVTV